MQVNTTFLLVLIADMNSLGNTKPEHTVALVHSPQVLQKQVHTMYAEHKGHSTFTLL